MHSNFNMSFTYAAEYIIQLKNWWFSIPIVNPTVFCFNYVVNYKLLATFLFCISNNTQEEEKRQEKEEKAKLEEPEATDEDLALKEMTEPTAKEEEELKKSKEHEKKEQLCNISQALAVLASASVWS